MGYRVQPDHRVIKGSDDITDHSLTTAYFVSNVCLRLTLAGFCGSWFQIFEKHLLSEARFGLEGFFNKSLLSGLLEVTGEDLGP